MYGNGEGTFSKLEVSAIHLCTEHAEPLHAPVLQKALPAKKAKQGQDITKFFDRKKLSKVCAGCCTSTELSLHLASCANA